MSSKWSIWCSCILLFMHYSLFLPPWVSNKHLNRSGYCSFLRQTVACHRVCQHAVMGICEEFGCLNDMRLDSGVCLHICTDVSITPAAAVQTHRHTHTDSIELNHSFLKKNSVVIPSLEQSAHKPNPFKMLKYFHQNTDLRYIELHLLYGHMD